jgi:hypothetical protein
MNAQTSTNTTSWSNITPKPQSVDIYLTPTLSKDDYSKSASGLEEKKQADKRDLLSKYPSVINRIFENLKLSIDHDGVNTFFQSTANNFLDENDGNHLCDFTACKAFKELAKHKITWNPSIGLYVEKTFECKMCKFVTNDGLKNCCDKGHRLMIKESDPWHEQLTFTGSLDVSNLDLDNLFTILTNLREETAQDALMVCFDNKQVWFIGREKEPSRALGKNVDIHCINRKDKSWNQTVQDIIQTLRNKCAKKVFKECIEKKSPLGATFNAAGNHIKCFIAGDIDFLFNSCFPVEIFPGSEGDFILIDGGQNEIKFAIFEDLADSNLCVCGASYPRYKKNNCNANYSSLRKKAHKWIETRYQSYNNCPLSIPIDPNLASPHRYFTDDPETNDQNKLLRAETDAREKWQQLLNELNSR